MTLSQRSGTKVNRTFHLLMLSGVLSRVSHGVANCHQKRLGDPLFRTCSAPRSSTPLARQPCLSSPKNDLFLASPRRPPSPRVTATWRHSGRAYRLPPASEDEGTGPSVRLGIHITKRTGGRSLCPATAVLASGILDFMCRICCIPYSSSKKSNDKAAFFWTSDKPALE